MTQDASDELVSAYIQHIAMAFAAANPQVHVIEGMLACLTMAARMLAMLDPETRDQICDVFEDNFRDDVEQLAAKPGARSGLIRMQ